MANAHHVIPHESHEIVIVATALITTVASAMNQDV